MGVTGVQELEKVPLYCTREVLRAMPSGLDPLSDGMMVQVLEQDDVRTAGYCKAVLGGSYYRLPAPALKRTRCSC